MNTQEITIDSSYFLPDNNEQQQDQNQNSEQSLDDLKMDMINAFKDNIRSKQDTINEMSEEDKKFIFSNSLKFMKAMKDVNVEKAGRYLDKLLRSNIGEKLQAPEKQSVPVKDKNVEVTDTVIKRRKNYF